MNKNPVSQNHTVMLVDDCSICNYVNKKIMRFYGFAKEVIKFTSSTKALQFLQEIVCTDDMPDYVFVNLNMRTMDGNKFAEEFDKLSWIAKRKTKLVLLSSTTNPIQLLQIAKSKNIFAHMSRPLIKSNIDELVALAR